MRVACGLKKGVWLSGRRGCSEGEGRSGLSGGIWGTGSLSEFGGGVSSCVGMGGKVAVHVWLRMD